MIKSLKRLGASFHYFTLVFIALFAKLQKRSPVAQLRQMDQIVIRIIRPITVVYGWRNIHKNVNLSLQHTQCNQISVLGGQYFNCHRGMMLLHNKITQFSLTNKKLPPDILCYVAKSNTLLYFGASNPPDPPDLSLCCNSWFIHCIHITYIKCYQMVMFIVPVFLEMNVVLIRLHQKKT